MILLLIIAVIGYEWLPPDAEEERKCLLPCAHPPPRRGAAFYFPRDQIVMSMTHV